MLALKTGEWGSVNEIVLRRAEHSAWHLTTLPCYSPRTLKCWRNTVSRQQIQLLCVDNSGYYLNGPESKHSGHCQLYELNQTVLPIPLSIIYNNKLIIC